MPALLLWWVSILNLKDWMITRQRTAGLLLLAGLSALPSSSAAQCRTANAETATMIKYLTKLVTAPPSDLENYSVRQRYGLPAVDASSVVLVDKAAICKRAIRKYRSTVPTSPASTGVYVVAVGDTYVVWGAPAPPGSEFQLHLVMNSKFVVLAGFTG
jgi:hypothetical protein